MARNALTHSESLFYGVSLKNAVAIAIKMLSVTGGDRLGKGFGIVTAIGSSFNETI